MLCCQPGSIEPWEGYYLDQKQILPCVSCRYSSGLELSILAWSNLFGKVKLLISSNSVRNRKSRLYFSFVLSFHCICIAIYLTSCIDSVHLRPISLSLEYPTITSFLLAPPLPPAEVKAFKMRTIDWTIYPRVISRMYLVLCALVRYFFFIRFISIGIKLPMV